MLGDYIHEYMTSVMKVIKGPLWKCDNGTCFLPRNMIKIKIT